ncbi:hypothetical protein [Microcoleus sp. bin38.metabat.b11b12b14.051]|uniref:hypothetical protein n=1 Tax=Microcoleus sp. bin38.metabat.b11b12b14.051 TaxID=2742709 RepID=UPI0025F29F25|nr:hypothetical protein [Microcoleus sp. bin38.metabat.b11b12b14.051]
MAIVTPGTGATLQSPTLEGQFVQLVEFFQAIEKTGGNQTSYFASSFDSDDLLFSGTFSVPILPGATGAVFSGDTARFLIGTFAPGTGGTFTQATALDYFLAVAMRLVTFQNDVTKNPQNATNVTLEIDANKNIASGTFNLPFTKTVTPTGIAITPGTYLL